jgi:ribosomal protein S18 acetylase RimI-like enzyme
MSQIYPVTNQDEEVDFLNLRSVTPADYQAIREVATLSRRASLGHFMTEEEIAEEVDHYYRDEVLNGIISNPANAMYVAERGDKILGYCSALPKDRRGRPRILQFYVRPDAQRNGVGELLFERSRNHLKEAGVKEMVVSTLAENTIGRSFFEKMGLSLVQMYESSWDGTTHTIAVYHMSLR